MIVVGTGSRLRGDDSAGPYVIDLLKERMALEGPPRVTMTLIDADVMPENYTKPIRESGADHCMFIDAVDMGLRPGTIRRIPIELIDATIPCSHSLPMSLVMGYIGESVPKVELMGIQISVAGLFHEMSDAVKDACGDLADILWEGRGMEVPLYQKGDRGAEVAENHCW